MEVLQRDVQVWTEVLMRSGQTQKDGRGGVLRLHGLQTGKPLGRLHQSVVVLQCAGFQGLYRRLRGILSQEQTVLSENPGIENEIIEEFKQMC